MIAAARRIRGMWPRRILYVQYTNPGAYPPLQHSSQMLAARNWEVLFLGITIPGEDDMHVEPHPRIAVRQLATGGSGWSRRLHYLTYTLWITAWALRWRPEWIYASDPIACPAVLLISLLPGLNLLYHEHDSPQRGGARMSARVMRWARRRVARRARIRILPNEVRVANFARSIGDSSRMPIECVWNCPRRDEVGPVRKPHSGSPLRVLYHGSIVPSRLPLRLLEALRDVPVHLQVIGYETQGHLGYVQTLRDHAARLGIGDRVRILSGMSRRDLLIASRQSDVGLAFVPGRTDDSNLRWMTGASNKPFDYLAGGLAVLVSDLPDWREMYVDPGYALACNADDPRSVTDAFRWLLAHPQEMRAMGERGRQRIAADWNYETQFARVLERLTQVSPEYRAEPVTMR
jgi:glycosyltransferase involved in cell wall biosynthesis